MTDGWLNLVGLSAEAGVSERTLRNWAKKWYDAGEFDVVRKSAGNWEIRSDRVTEFLAGGKAGPHAPPHPSVRSDHAGDPEMWRLTADELTRQRIRADAAEDRERVLIAENKRLTGKLAETEADLRVQRGEADRLRAMIRVAIEQPASLTD